MTHPTHIAKATTAGAQETTVELGAIASSTLSP